MKKIKELFIKYKEIIMYLIFGVATTGVNWVVYSLLMKAVLVHAPGSDDVKMTVSNVIAWIAAVIFAFITNKLWVFESKSWVPKVAAREFVSFVVSRLATGVIEWFGPLLLFKIGLDQDNGGFTIKTAHLTTTVSGNGDPSVIEEAARKKALEDAAQQASETGRQHGLSAAGVDALRTAIMGQL